MPAVIVEITRKPEPIVEDPEAVVLVANLEELLKGSLPGCGDDNPYN
ncbi:MULTISPECIES: hypothetical protein [Streptomyces]|uniref:Uncharacterized protein n=1 Tax=Streptomyces viridochromogenes Tue57 TaxID=1160705 RepID=L8P6V4_STRVR|nr:hypothetical protein [Streptomyces viridochromogenes]ELS51027.1 hypothetical protein STVIR_8029 [Streptomyces viridochromogenes Tue57]